MSDRRDVHHFKVFASFYRDCFTINKCLHTKTPYCKMQNAYNHPSPFNMYHYISIRHVTLEKLQFAGPVPPSPDTLICVSMYSLWNGKINTVHIFVIIPWDYFSDQNLSLCDAESHIKHNNIIPIAIFDTSRTTVDLF